MTQYYKMPGFSLASANISTKVLLSLFLLAVLGGLAVALLQYYDRAGWSERGAVEWIQGNESDPAAKIFKPEKTYRELISLTHDHSFALPILLFVLLHLVALCSISERAKIALYVTGFLSLAGSLTAPWLIAYQGPGWSPLLCWSGLGLTATIGLAAHLCLFETWLARPLRRWRNRPEPPAPDPLVNSSQRG
ncbi:MAG: hypothetical protein HY717_12175 [Planctomycetes bacterium]|nr:hypothetical protein [Planctomycetota bacterium]